MVEPCTRGAFFAHVDVRTGRGPKPWHVRLPSWTMAPQSGRSWKRLRLRYVRQPSLSPFPLECQLPPRWGMMQPAGRDSSRRSKRNEGEKPRARACQETVVTTGRGMAFQPRAEKPSKAFSFTVCGQSDSVARGRPNQLLNNRGAEWVERRSGD